MLVFYLAALDSDDDKNKFEYIYCKYYRFMLHTAAGIIKNSSLAEDAVHETFVQLLRGIDTLRIDNERALKSYLYMVTRERSIDFLRKWERRRGAQPDYESLAAALDNYAEPEEVALTNLQLDKAIALLDENASDLPPDTGFAREGVFHPRDCQNHRFERVQRQDPHPPRPGHAAEIVWGAGGVSRI